MPPQPQPQISIFKRRKQIRDFFSFSINSRTTNDQSRWSLVVDTYGYFTIKLSKLKQFQTPVNLFLIDCCVPQIIEMSPLLLTLESIDSFPQFFRLLVCLTLAEKELIFPQSDSLTFSKKSSCIKLTLKAIKPERKSSRQKCAFFALSSMQNKNHFSFCIFVFDFCRFFFLSCVGVLLYGNVDRSISVWKKRRKSPGILQEKQQKR